MATWSELLSKQVKAYAEENTEWKQVAGERILPFLNSRLPAMNTAHEHLIRYCEPVYLAAEKIFDINFPATFVIYVGLGLGAGWATSYLGRPAILFGLENIAEEGWTKPAAVEGLIAHEIGHLIHNHWREKVGKDFASGPWWQLYTEGFAQRCEHLVLGRESWHMTLGAGYQDWLPWCRQHSKWLAAEFLRRVKTNGDIRPFFGSWQEVYGRKQTGYFLGHELIKLLERHFTIVEIARMDDVENKIMQLATELTS